MLIFIKTRQELLVWYLYRLIDFTQLRAKTNLQITLTSQQSQSNCFKRLFMRNTTGKNIRTHLGLHPPQTDSEPFRTSARDIIMSTFPPQQNRPQLRTRLKITITTSTQCRSFTRLSAKKILCHGTKSISA